MSYINNNFTILYIVSIVLICTGGGLLFHLLTTSSIPYKIGEPGQILKVTDGKVRWEYHDIPPEYEIVCDYAHKVFGIKMPKGYIIELDDNGKPFTSRERAIERAWDQYNYKEKKYISPYRWEVCK